MTIHSVADGSGVQSATGKQIYNRSRLGLLQLWCCSGILFLCEYQLRVYVMHTIKLKRTKAKLQLENKKQTQHSSGTCVL